MRNCTAANSIADPSAKHKRYDAPPLPQGHPREDPREYDRFRDGRGPPAAQPPYYSQRR